MTGVSDYDRRVAYFRSRYLRNTDELLRRQRAYRKRNREAIKVARGLGVSVDEGRRLIASMKTRETTNEHAS